MFSHHLCNDNFSVSLSMRLLNWILIFVGAYYNLSRHFVLAVFGNCFGCLRPPRSSPIDAANLLVMSGGLSVNSQNVFNDMSRAPIVYAGRHHRYGIYCGAQNLQVQASLNDAINVAGTLLKDYQYPYFIPLETGPFLPIEQIFPIRPGDFSSILLPLTSFVLGMYVQRMIRGVPTGLSRRSVVCATPTMLEDYGIASSYHDVCRQDPTIVAYHPALTATLMLCPSFFRLPVRVHERQCPKWNRFLQTFYMSYEPPTVEYQTYTLIRGFLDVASDKEENIVVSPNPRVPNWNELNSLPLYRKKSSSALYQLYIAR